MVVISRKSLVLQGGVVYRVWIYGNNLKTIPTSIATLPYLLAVEAQGNPLKDLPKAFNGIMTVANPKYRATPDRFLEIRNLGKAKNR